MAWAQAQTSSAAFAAGSATTVTQAYGSNVVSGNLLCVCFHWADSAVTMNSVTDTVGTTYAACSAQVRLVGLGVAQMWYGLAAGSGANTAQGNFSSTIGSRYECVTEYSGIASLDQGTGTSGTSAAPNSGNVTTGFAPELGIGFTFVANTATAGASWTSRNTVNGDCVEDKNLTPTGAFGADFTQASGNWIALIATFKESVAPASLRSFNPVPFMSNGRI